MENLIAACIAFLNIKCPVDIRLKSNLAKKYSNCRALYYSWTKHDKPIKHIIQVQLSDDSRNLDTIIAHEFVHAWQAEYRPKSKVHGKSFQDMALNLRGFLCAEGFDISDDIYCPESDV